MSRCQILQGDAFSTLCTLEPESVQVCCTSPPFYGLRDYGHAEQIGLEKTPDDYVWKLVQVFREVRRVLHRTGLLWLNLGDSYSGGNKGNSGEIRPGDKQGTNKGSWGTRRRDTGNLSPTRNGGSGLPEGNLLGIPWRVAFALQQDGWYLRSAVVWSKRNPMPESVAGWRWEKCRVKVEAARRPRQEGHHSDGREYSVPVDKMPQTKWTDCPGCKKCELNDGLVLRKGSWRPTQSHEYIFLLAKSADYYADGEAVKEPCESGASDIRKMLEGKSRIGGLHKDLEDPLQKANADTNIGQRRAVGSPAGRNKRSVWEVNTAPFPGAHFATWPMNLVKPMILSSTPDAGICSSCGTPWARVLEREFHRHEKWYGEKGLANRNSRGSAGRSYNEVISSATTGWKPACACNADSVPATVLDCFAGSGATGCVALEYGRRFVGVELNPQYVKLAEERIAPYRSQEVLL